MSSSGVDQWIHLGRIFGALLEGLIMGRFYASFAFALIRRNHVLNKEFSGHRDRDHVSGEKEPDLSPDGPYRVCGYAW